MAGEAASWSSALLADDGSASASGGAAAPSPPLFPALIEGGELTDIGAALLLSAACAPPTKPFVACASCWRAERAVAVARGSLLCTFASAVCLHAAKHDRLCFRHPLPDSEEGDTGGLCAVPRDSAAEGCVAPEGCMAPDVDGASV